MPAITGQFTRFESGLARQTKVLSARMYVTKSVLRFKLKSQHIGEIDSPLLLFLDEFIEHLFKIGYKCLHHGVLNSVRAPRHCDRQST
jgi:hypothetical protein